MDKVYDNLLQKRTVFVNGQVNMDMACDVVAQIMYLDSIDNKDIKVIINSPGGSVTAGLGIYDAIIGAKSTVSTVCVGLAASMGSIILLSGAKGKRFIAKNGRVLLHQPLLGGFEGQATDVQIQAQQMVKTRSNLYGIIRTHTNKDLNTISSDCERDFWLNAQQAIAYGIADKIYKW